MTKTVDIVIPVYNALELVNACVMSVLEHRDAKQHRLILIDDGSDVPTAEFLKSMSKENTHCTLLRSDHATGFTKAANRGLRESTADLVIVLNSDTRVPPRWVEKILDVMFNTPGVGVVGPLSNAASYQSIPRQQPNEMERLAGQTPINRLPPGRNLVEVNQWLENSINTTPVRVPLVHGFCFAMRREVIDDIGLFDELAFPLGFGEEDDYCIRAVDAGWSLAIATNTYVWHEKSGSYADAQRTLLVAEGREKFLLRNGRVRRANVLNSLRESGRTIEERVAPMIAVDALVKARRNLSPNSAQVVGIGSTQ
jgi:GT2 family glycosyltransferase